MCKKVLALLLVSALALTMLGGCSSQSKKKEETKSTSTTVKNEEIEPGDPSKVAAEYVGTYNDTIYSMEAGGFLYRKDDKYGVRNLDGSYDSGAVYADAEAIGQDTISVTTKEYTSSEDLDGLNSTGLIDINGKEIIPAKYALLDEIGGRFVQAITATAITEDKSQHLMYVSNKHFTLGATEGDTMYAGNWVIYDVTTGKQVPNATGTTATNFTLYGDVISYIADGVRRYVSVEGKVLPDAYRVFADGSYMPRNEKTVYDSAMNKRFDVEPSGFEPLKWENGYYVMSKSVDGKICYALADETGKIVSDEFDNNNGSLSVLEGGLVANDAGVYTAEGRCVLEKKYYSHSYYGGYWLIRDADKNVYLMDSNYEVTKVCQLDDAYTYSLDTYRFAVTQKTDMYYSIAQKKFVAGTIVGLGVAMVANGETKDLYNTLTDEVLLTGYTSYSVCEDERQVRYVFAGKQEGGAKVYDFYVLK